MQLINFGLVTRAPCDVCFIRRLDVQFVNPQKWRFPRLKVFEDVGIRLESVRIGAGRQRVESSILSKRGWNGVHHRIVESHARLYVCLYICIKSGPFFVPATRFRCFGQAPDRDFLAFIKLGAVRIN